MTEVNPLVSVLIPTYNGMPYVKETIKCVLASTYVNIEVVCVDDFSSDGTLECLQQMALTDSRVKIVHRETRGGNAARGITYGVPHCSGEYFFYLSHDDTIACDCIERCVRRCEETGLDIAIPDTVLWGNGSIVRRLGPPDGDHRLVMDGVEAFRRAAVYDLSGFCLKRMSLVRRVGYEDHRFDSCDKSCLIHYYRAGKVCFADTEFYYRVDNQAAITRGWNAAKYEYLLTGCEVLRFMDDESMPDSAVRSFVKSLQGRFLDFRMQLDNLAEGQYPSACEIYSKALVEFRQILIRRCSWWLWMRTYLAVFSLRRRMRHVGRVCRYGICSVFAPESRACRRLRAKLSGVSFFDRDAAYRAKTESASRLGCRVGKCTYAGNNVRVGDPRTVIGSFCSLADNITIGPGDHPLGYLSTSLFFYVDSLGLGVQGNQEDNIRPVHISDDVWIGCNVFIRGGVTIGTGAVVGAGAVVVKDVPPYAVVGGVPAQVIRYRFDTATRERLLKSRWWEKDDDLLRRLDFRDVEKCLGQLGDENA